MEIAGISNLLCRKTQLSFTSCNSRALKKFDHGLRRGGSRAIASDDSVHHNIAEGYYRRPTREYLQHLYIALGSVSGLITCHNPEQLTEAGLESLDSLAYKLENGLSKLVGSSECKEQSGDWIDYLIVKESNATHNTAKNHE